MAENFIVCLEVALDSVHCLVDSLNRSAQANAERILPLELLVRQLQYLLHRWEILAVRARVHSLIVGWQASQAHVSRKAKKKLILGHVRIYWWKRHARVVWVWGGKRRDHGVECFILVPRGRAPFGQHPESRPLGRSKFLSIRRVILSYSQPIGFFRLDSEHAQIDGKSVNRGLPVLDLPRGRSQRSRFLVQTKRSAASGDENAWDSARPSRVQSSTVYPLHIFSPYTTAKYCANNCFISCCSYTCTLQVLG